MCKLNLFRKRAYFALFLFFLSSCSKSTRQWESTSCSVKGYQSNRQVWASNSEFRELEVEIVKSKKEVFFYLNSLSGVIPFEAKESQAKIQLIIGNDEQEVWVDRFAGGQRIKLNSQTTNEVMTSLKNGQVVEIHVGRYFAIIEPFK